MPQSLNLVLQLFQLALVARRRVPQLVHPGVVVDAPTSVGKLKRAQALFRKPERAVVTSERGGVAHTR